MLSVFFIIYGVVALVVGARLTSSSVQAAGGYATPGDGTVPGWVSLLVMSGYVSFVAALGAFFI